MKQFAMILCMLSWALTNPVSAGCFDDREQGMDWSGCKKTVSMTPFLRSAASTTVISRAPAW